MQMQKRAVALATALMLVCVGLVARWHETEVAHAHEQSGRVIHAQELADHHEHSSTDHLHGSAADGHVGDCALLAMAHDSSVLAAPIVLATRAGALAPIVSRDAVTWHTTLAAYRLAPKTSPPAV
jgi:ABC-type nickel/cobalt efflux system permease component RcnA